MDVTQIGAIGTSIAAVLTALGGVLLGLRTRSDRDEETTIKRLEKELDDARKQVVEWEAKFNRERDSGLRWYERALYWYGRCNDMRNAARSARQLAESYSRLGMNSLPVWEENLDIPSGVAEAPSVNR